MRQLASFLIIGSILLLTSCSTYNTACDCPSYDDACPSCVPCDNYHECIDHVDKYGCNFVRPGYTDSRYI